VTIVITGTYSYVVLTVWLLNFTFFGKSDVEDTHDVESSISDSMLLLLCVLSSCSQLFDLILGGDYRVAIDSLGCFPTKGAIVGKHVTIVYGVVYFILRDSVRQM
jgi:hypothetical protein